ncbi:MAG: hypothetical protein EAX95_15675 [Candidatus Thorarchaeota archaeon]|nr:hypothetical protein [Candidatus Thorarchaeota archaeon]
MVIQGQRYGNNPLLEMRIQDITLEVDLSRQDPNHPGQEQDFDGTASPLKKTTAEADFNLMSLMPEVITSWTGPWPLFHVEIHKDVPHPEGILHVTAHTAKNLLGITEQSGFFATGDDSIGDWPILVQCSLHSNGFSHLLA